MEEQRQTPKHTTPPPERGWEEDTVSIIDLLLVIARHRRLIGFTTLSVLAIGLLIAILSPPEYTALAKVIRETDTDTSAGLSGGHATTAGMGQPPLHGLIFTTLVAKLGLYPKLFVECFHGE